MLDKNILNYSNIAMIVSRYHSEITQKLFDSAIASLKEHGLHDNQITVVWVPGAVEIPIAAQRLAQTEKYSAIITLGAVIFGETRHFDFVCQQVSQGCLQVSLNNNIPVIFGVLTTDNLQQAHERAGGSKGNMGQYAADSAVEMLSVLHQIEL